MNRNSDLILTAIAPAVWGSTYLVTTEFLPDGYPVTVAMLRTLPAGLLLLLVLRHLPQGMMWLKVMLLGALNITIFQALLFIAAYRLPGGVAATVGAIQPLFVIFLAHYALGSRIMPLSVVAALGGVGGVALLLLGGDVAWDAIGIAAAIGGAVTMALGTVLSRRWQGETSALTFTSWQLGAGGLFLLPFSLVLEPPLPALNGENIMALLYLGLFGAGFAYALWFRGVSRLEPSVVSSLGFLSPMTAVLLGWLVLDQRLSHQAVAGIAVTLGSVWLSQNAHRLRAGVKPAPQAT